MSEAATVPVLAPRSSVLERERRLAQAIDRGYFANLGVVRLLGEHYPPLTASVEAGMAYYAGEDGSPGGDFPLWLFARSMALITDAFDEFRGVKRITPVPSPGLPRPDEAPGLDVPPATGDPAERQPALPMAVE